MVFNLSSCCSKSRIESDLVEVFPKGEKVVNGNFTGSVWLQRLAEGDKSLNVSIGNVTFEPGARTKWHRHPSGQIILVMDGSGYYQEKGQPKKIVHKGDVIKCPSNIEHWHGAIENSHFVQVAITDNQKGAVVWLSDVTQEEYCN